MGLVDRVFPAMLLMVEYIVSSLLRLYGDDHAMVG